MIPSAIAFAAALVAGAVLYPWLIRRLRGARMGQLIREEGPASHRSKAGTPTAGGILFPAVVAVLYLALDRGTADGLCLLALLAGAGLGFWDDLKAILGGRNLGLRAREKMLFQMAAGAVLGYLGWRAGFSRQLVPFDGTMSIGAWMVPLGAIAFAAGSNALNLTDGSDGLAAGAGAIAFLGLWAAAVLEHRPSLAVFPAAVAGVLVAFLLFNFFPARIFMGDTGSLALGMALVMSATVTGLLWYLPLLGLVFVLETLSVILQVASFKLTGKRIFRMSPLHHHFHQLGWPEPRVAAVSYALSAAAAAATIAIAHPGAA